MDYLVSIKPILNSLPPISINITGLFERLYAFSTVRFDYRTKQEGYFLITIRDAMAEIMPITNEVPLFWANDIYKSSRIEYYNRTLRNPQVSKELENWYDKLGQYINSKGIPSNTFRLFQNCHYIVKLLLDFSKVLLKTNGYIYDWQLAEAYKQLFG